MKIRIIGLLLILSFMILELNALTLFKSEYTELENSYQKIDDATFEAQLNALKPIASEEKAFVAYYKAKLIPDVNTMIIEMVKVADTYPKTEYGQKACLELGIIYFLQRDTGKSSIYLAKITLPSINDKNLWLSQVYLKQGENDKAIQYSQSYLVNSTDPEKMETAYYVIANAYINQRRYDNVQSLLDRLDSVQGLPKHNIYYNYLRGYAYDMCNNNEMALRYYRNVFKLDRYSQYAFMAEDRLLSMKARMRDNLDISFIYPDSVYHPAPVVPDTAKTITVVLPPPGIDPPIESVQDSLQMVKNTGHGIFLQLGRFSSESNAQNLMLKLKDDQFSAIYFPTKLDNKITYRVLMGPYKTEAQAEKIRVKLNEKSYGSIIIKR
ncbi:MAG TPA: SPOR domain-containing protein [Candidatus Cloacimonadota bacterium]|nr:SPOR domain-containing protein [Candidatus Cloacimonadota bacterium]